MSQNSYYIASGFKEDCLRLLSIFKKENDIRFETFCKCWQQMKFSLIFLCRESFADLLEFCEESLHIAKQFFLKPYTFKERIGGLYLLYGLYSKMPVENLVKIRITMHDFEQITQLHSEIKEGEHFDANYILSKMFIDNAFVFCIFSKEMGLQKQHKPNRRHEVDNHLSIIPSIHHLNKPNELMHKLNQLSEVYIKEKAKFSETLGTKSIQLYDHEKISSIMSEFQQLDKFREKSISIDSANLKKKTNKKGSKVRPVLGHGFDTDSSEEDENEDEDDQSLNNLFKTEYKLIEFNDSDDDEEQDNSSTNENKHNCANK